MGRVVRAAAGQQPRVPRAAEQLRDAVLAALNLNIFARHADRVRMANIAQMVNVLQAMVLTDKEKMVLTPTYHVFKMYLPFQDATFVPVTFDAGTLHARRHHAAARGCHRGEGLVPARCGSRSRTWTPIGPAKSRRAWRASTASPPQRETLTAPKVDSVNTFDAPRTVMPKPLQARVQAGGLTLTLDPKSVTVVALQP